MGPGMHSRHITRKRWAPRANNYSILGKSKNNGAELVRREDLKFVDRRLTQRRDIAMNIHTDERQE